MKKTLERMIKKPPKPIVEEGKLYEIWSEGFACTGQNGGAICHGQARGNSFKEACDNFSRRNVSFYAYYNPERMTYWGCRLFDNRWEAQKTFG